MKRPNLEAFTADARKNTRVYSTDMLTLLRWTENVESALVVAAKELVRLRSDKPDDHALMAVVMQIDKMLG